MCVRARIGECVRVLMYACMCVYMCVYLCVCVCFALCVECCACVRECARVYVCECVQPHDYSKPNMILSVFVIDFAPTCISRSNA